MEINSAVLSSADEQRPPKALRKLLTTINYVVITIIESREQLHILLDWRFLAFIKFPFREIWKST